MELRRIACCLAVVALVALPSTAAAGERKRHAKQGSPALAGPSTSGARQSEMRDKDRREPPAGETPEERRRRWERWLRSKDRVEVLSALDEMHRQETAEAREMLVEFARTTRDDRLKAYALLALGWRGNRAASEFLAGKHGASSSRGRVAAAACRALGAIGDAAQRPLLVERLGHEDGDVVAGALGGLVALDPEDARLPDLLERLAVHEDERVRAESAAALAAVSPADWRARLETAVADPSPAVRAAACDALGSRADEASAPLLLRLQEDDTDEAVRAAALRALLAIDAALSDD